MENDPLDSIEIDSSGDITFNDDTTVTTPEPAKLSDDSSVPLTTEEKPVDEADSLKARFTQEAQRRSVLEAKLEQIMAQNEILLNKLANQNTSPKEEEAIDLEGITSDPKLFAEFLNRVVDAKLGKNNDLAKLPQLQKALEFQQFKTDNPTAFGGDGQLLTEFAEIMEPALKQGKSHNEAYEPIKKTLSLVQKLVQSAKPKSAPATGVSTSGNGVSGKPRNVLSPEDMRSLVQKTQTESAGPIDGDIFNKDVVTIKDAARLAITQMKKARLAAGQLPDED